MITKFTFQYGSILIFMYSIPLSNFNLFTFQYGSILIYINFSNATISSIIYIPIWFYFNAYGVTWSNTAYRFTFQYGSILIKKVVWIGDSLTNIYIPIWFYFNYLFTFIIIVGY